MNKKDIKEIKRRIRLDKNNATHIVGCYVNGEGNIISRFSVPVSTLSVDDETKYMNLFRKTLSGKLGKNLINVGFTTEQVSNSESCLFLRKLRDCDLEDDALLDEFFNKIIQSINLKMNYLIMLMEDVYDVPKYNKNDDKEESEEQFRYYICSVCEVKKAKTSLSYDNESKCFKSSESDMIASSPMMGFMYPSFEDRTCSIYNLLYYTSDVGDIHEPFSSVLFDSKMPLPAKEQKENFSSMIAESLQDECSFSVVKKIHDQISNAINDHNADKSNQDELHISKNDVKSLLNGCGVSESSINNFEQKYDETIGTNSSLIPENIINYKKFEVTTAQVSIKVDPDRLDLITTKQIDGVNYILVRADSGVLINGLDVKVD